MVWHSFARRLEGRIKDISRSEEINVKQFGLLISLLFGTAATAANAQTTSLDLLRADTHDRLVQGHQPLAYSQTDEAMEIIHADEAIPGNLLLFYTGRSQDSDQWVSGDSQNGWNREHLWPQSRGARAFPAKSDLFHLMPTDASVNQRRGNLNFDDGGSPEGEAPDTFLDADSFEPRDEVKGDVARSLFYVDVRYEGTNGEPDLSLVDASTPTGGTSLGDLCTLLAWHQSDPVSAEEIARNNATQAEQGNRNVFIDEPDLATAIFGHECVSTPVVATGVTTPAAQERLRIATWNIANLHHVSGVPLRSGSKARDDEDFARLAALAEQLDLDIAALQEIGSPAALERVFPSADYHVVMSDRYVPGSENLPADQRGIYTAMVFSRERFATAPEVIQMPALSILHIGFDRDGTPSSRATRGGLIAEIELGGETVRLLGVHLKSFCHRWSLDPITDQHPTTGKPFSSRFDCRTLRAQLSILESWIEQQAAQGVTSIVLGDFNRNLNTEDSAGNSIDDFWLDLNDGTPNSLSLSKGPLGLDDVCWPDHSDRFDQHIDLFVFDENLSDLVSGMDIQKHTMGFENDPKYSGKDKQRLSDHCPVVMTLTR